MREIEVEAGREVDLRRRAVRFAFGQQIGSIRQPRAALETQRAQPPSRAARIQDNDPILFSLADDVRTAGHRGPVLIPRGSSVVGRVVTSQRAGHFFGRSEMNIQVQEIITPTGEVYDGVSSKIIEVAKKRGLKAEVKADGGIQGPVHRQRDTFLLLFPPT